MQAPATDWITRFRALGDETRLGLLCALLGEELSVGELSEIMQAGQPGVSRHLSSLRDAGLVVARKQGSTTYYRIQPGDPLLEGPVGAELRRRSIELGLAPHIERIVARRRARAEAFFDEQAEELGFTPRAAARPGGGALRAGAAHPARLARGRHRNRHRRACFPSSPSSPGQSWRSTSPKRCCGVPAPARQNAGPREHRVRQSRFAPAPDRDASVDAAFATLVFTTRKTPPPP